MGVSVEVVRKPQKPIPEEVAKRWAEVWAKEGIKVDWQKLMPPKGFTVLPRRWVVERTFSWLSQNRRMSKDYERLAESSEAFVYAAMTRLMVRLLRHVPENYQTVSGRRILGSWYARCRIAPLAGHPMVGLDLLGSSRSTTMCCACA